MRDLDIFLKLREWLQQRENVWLCTVLGTWGSSPRPVGSLLACNTRADFIGSLSGGCVEEDLLARIANGEFSSPVVRVRYGASAEEAARLRLPCGGILDVAVEKIPFSAAVAHAVDTIVALLSLRQRTSLQRDFVADQWWVENPLPRQPALQFETGSDGQLLSLRQTLGPQYRLLLIGISEVSRAVAQMALLLDYEILVCDPRPEARCRWDIAGVTVLSAMPDDAVRQYGDDECCAILALTHDPRIDDMGLMEAFATRAFYIGAMGSQRTSDNRRERLLTLDVTAENLRRLHAPIGLDTGSKTPAEIAVSVLAQLTAVRSGKIS
ncbi:MAG TPA: XdhC family protein [Pseudomonadales bacterium]|nr:XdhC family protein [Pseudomonadales bacterium]